MKPIPISAAAEIARRYGYHQVVIVARQVGDDGGEHVTTYGVDARHCSVAARMGNFFKHKLMGWPDGKAEQVEAPGARAVLEAVSKALDEQGVKGGWARRHLEDRVLYHLRATQPTASNAGERDNLIAKLQACVDDPMWANHAEISKFTLRQAIAALASKPPAGE